MAKTKITEKDLKSMELQQEYEHALAIEDDALQESILKQVKELYEEEK